MAASETLSSEEDRDSSMFLVPRFNPSRKKRQENWTAESTLALVNVWRENILALRSLKRNGHIYQKIAHQLHLAGFHRATFEVKTKIGNLTNEYRRERKRLQTEGGASRFKFWDVIHEMMTTDVTTSDGSTSREGFDDDEDSAFCNGDELVFPASVHPVSITSEWSPIDYSDFEIKRETLNEEEGEDEDENPEIARCSVRSHCSHGADVSTTSERIKLETSGKEREEEEQKESHGGGCGAFVSTQRPSFPSPPPPLRIPPKVDSNERPKSRKRKFRTEDQRLKIMNLIYEENRRMNQAMQRAENEVLTLMREQIDLQRQSMFIEERIARAVEGVCRELTSSSSSSSLQRQCNGNSSSISDEMAHHNGLL